jgi:hypothetical protein
MIHYAVNDGEREKLYYLIASISIATSSLLFLIDLSLIDKFILPSGFVIYGMLIQLYDKFLWKVKPFNYFNKLPNLNGKWTGKSYVTTGEENNLKVTITQTWRRIDIVVETNESISNICSATFYLDNEDNKSIKYIYSVKPIKPDTKFNKFGEGCVELRYREIDNNFILEGNFFSSKFRGGYAKFIKN